MIFKISKPLFWLLNCLKSRKIISPINDPILLQSASELAKKIRHGEVKILNENNYIYIYPTCI